MDKSRAFTSLTNLTVITVSQWLESIVKKSFFKEYPVYTISNGIDVNVFKPLQNAHKSICQKCQLDWKHILLGVANIWSQRKGLETYLELSKFLDSKYVIILIGLNKKQLAVLPKNIIGIERTDSLEKLSYFYSAASIVLNLSVEETFGLTTVEGMSCGTPGIVYNCTASPELIDKTTGIIIEPGEIQQLVTAIEQIVKQGKDYYTKACRERVLRLYKKEDRYQDYINLYENILKSKD